METNQKNQHLTNMVEKVTSDFVLTVTKEESLSNILLKGHLFTENLLEEVLAVFDYKGKSFNRLSFHEKVRCLSEVKDTQTGILHTRIEEITPALFALNEVRNNLAHDFHYQINEGSVNKIGIVFGSEYILNKYESGHTKVKENLIFCLRKIVYILGRIMYVKAEALKREKKRDEEKNTQKAIQGQDTPLANPRV